MEWIFAFVLTVIGFASFNIWIGRSKLRTDLNKLAKDIENGRCDLTIKTKFENGVSAPEIARSFFSDIVERHMEEKNISRYDFKNPSFVGEIEQRLMSTVYGVIRRIEYFNNN